MTNTPFIGEDLLSVYRNPFSPALDEGRIDYEAFDRENTSV